MAGAPDLAPAGGVLDSLRRHKQVVERLARVHGLSNVRATEGGLVVVTADDAGVSYATLSRFEEAVAQAVGVDIDAYTDDVLANPGHTDALDDARPL